MEQAQTTLAPVDLIVDTREASKHKPLVAWLEKQGVAVGTQLLEAGDYVLNASPSKKRLCIERKTPMDFLSGLVKRDERGRERGRLWEQLDLLCQLKDEKTDIAIALVGWLGMIEKISKWANVSVCRIFDEITLSWQVPIIPFANQVWFQSWLLAKTRDLGQLKEKQVLPLRTHRRNLTVRDAALYLLEGLTGPQTATALLEKFGRAKAVANASEEELMEVEGIGKIRAKFIHAVFNHPWRLTVSSEDKGSETLSIKHKKNSPSGARSS